MINVSNDCVRLGVFEYEYLVGTGGKFQRNINGNGVLIYFFINPFFTEIVNEWKTFLFFKKHYTMVEVKRGGLDCRLQRLK